MITDVDILSFKDVNFSYRNEPLIAYLSITIKNGQHLCIVGNNGCGKTTIAKLALGLLIPDSGDVYVFGHNTKEDEEHLWRPRTSALFQTPENQIVNLSVFEDVMFGPKNLGLEKVIAKEQACESLSFCNIEHLASKNVNELSGGEIQMVALAGAIATHPSLLVLDEPTTHLDKVQHNKLLRIVKNLQDRGVSILSITHDVDYLKIADDVFKLQ